MDWKHYLDYDNMLENVVEILWKHPKIFATLSTTTVSTNQQNGWGN
jgi:hypothetical protein